MIGPRRRFFPSNDEVTKKAGESMSTILQRRIKIEGGKWKAPSTQVEICAPALFFFFFLIERPSLVWWADDVVVTALLMWWIGRSYWTNCI